MLKEFFKQGDFLECLQSNPLREHLDRAAPGRALGVVDLAQIQHVALHHTSVGDTAVLHHAPIAVLFAVFLACLRSQEHAKSIGKNANQFNGLGRHYRGSCGTRRGTIKHLRVFPRGKPTQIGQGGGE